MSNACRRFGAMVLVAASLLSFGCATHKVDNGWPNELTLTYRAQVTTKATTATAAADPANVARLKAYYQALQDLVGVANLEVQFIGCVGCQGLSGSPAPGELTFIFFREHRIDFYPFVAAWERVQASPLGNTNFTLSFDTALPVGGACPKPPPTCYPVPSCVSTDGCDANRYTTGCQLCPP